MYLSYLSSQTYRNDTVTEIIFIKYSIPYPHLHFPVPLKLDVSCSGQWNVSRSEMGHFQIRFFSTAMSIWFRWYNYKMAPPQSNWAPESLCKAQKTLSNPLWTCSGARNKFFFITLSHHSWSGNLLLLFDIVYPKKKNTDTKYNLVKIFLSGTKFL